MKTYPQVMFNINNRKSQTKTNVMKTEIKEFIIEEHANVCSEWKQKIEERYPELFKSELNVGKWYINEDKDILVYCTKLTDGFYESTFSGYGIRNKKWFSEENHFLRRYFKLATDKEVKDALIAEARKRGFKEGCVHSTTQSAKDRIILNAKERFCYVEWQNKLLLNNWSIFHDGKWATIIEEEETVWSILAKQNLVNPSDVQASIKKIQAELQSLKELLK